MNEEEIINTKRSLSSLASEANEEINSNQLISNKLNLIQYWINYNKNLVQKYYTEQFMNKEEIKTDLSYYIYNLKENINENKLIVSNLKIKVKNLNDKIEKLVFNEEYEKNVEDNFLLNNSLIQNQNILKVLQINLKSIKKNYYNIESQRDLFYEPNEIFDDFYNYLKYNQDKLYVKCKRFNKIKKKINQNTNILKQLNKEINILQNRKFNMKKENQINEINIQTNMNNEITNLENNSFDESKTDIIIDDDVHSDEDFVLETKIDLNKNSLNYYSEELKKKIPNLNLKQIDYNKKKPPKEIDIYSLERRNNNDNIDDNIIYTKNKIKKILKKIKLNQEKIKSFEKNLELMENDLLLLKEKNNEND